MHTFLIKRLFKPRLLFLILGFLFLITALKILFVGYDIDEQYAVAMSYRLVKGDFPLLTMWEPHQTSGFLAALLMAPYLAIVKTTTGIILYLRLFGLLLHSLISFLLYKQLLHFSLSKNTGLLICCIWFFSLPKLMFLPEFSNLQLWCLLLMILCLLKYYTMRAEKEAPEGHLLFRPWIAGIIAAKQRKSAQPTWILRQQNHYTTPTPAMEAPLTDLCRGTFLHLGWLAGAGFFLALEVLSYPSTLLVFPLCLFFILKFRRKEKRLTAAELASFLLPCASGALLFLGWLLSRMNFTDLLSLLPLAASDGSHAIPLREKLVINGSSLLEILFYFAVYGAVSAAIFVILRKQKKFRLPLNYPSLLLLVTFAGQMLLWIFANCYPNYPLVEYFFLPCMGIWYYRKVCRKAKEKEKNAPSELQNARYDSIHLLTAFFVAVPLAAFLGIVIFTNHPLLVSSPFLIPCVTGVLALPGFAAKNFHRQRNGAVLSTGILVIWACVLLFGKLYMLRTTGGQHYTVFDEISLIRKGPAACLAADTETVRRYNRSLELLEETLPDGARVFYAGSSTGIYLMKEMEICTPSTISSPTFDEKINLYFSMHPEKIPEYVVCDADLSDRYGDTWLARYLKDHCEETAAAENDYLTVYRVTADY